MDFGVVLQTNPPAARTVQLAKLAEAHGFSHVWTFDSHLLWQEPYVIHSAILAETKRVTVGPFVTNPATRDWTVTASVFATLNEMYGNRTDLRHRPRRLGRARHQRQAGDDERAARVDPRDPRARELPAGRVQRRDAAVPVEPRVRARGLGRRIRSAGAEAHRRGGRRLHPAAGRPRHRRVDDQDGAGCRGRRRPRPRLDRLLRRRADVHRRRLAAHARPVPVVRRDGRQPRRRHRGEVRPPRRARVPTRSPTTSPAATATTTTPTARPTTTTSTSCPTRSSTASASSAPPSEHIAKLEQLRALGVTQFAGYLQHDNKEETMRVYGETVIPALSEHVTAKTMTARPADRPAHAACSPCRRAADSRPPRSDAQRWSASAGASSASSRSC